MDSHSGHHLKYHFIPQSSGMALHQKASKRLSELARDVYTLMGGNGPHKANTPSVREINDLSMYAVFVL